jgi:peptidoglycan/LPS O-acetylase OafA/YrhL
VPCADSGRNGSATTRRVIRPRRGDSVPWLVLLGEASYSLYIIHWAGQTFLRLGFLGAWDTPAVHAVFLIATVAASVPYGRSALAAPFAGFGVTPTATAKRRFTQDRRRCHAGNKAYLRQ